MDHVCSQCHNNGSCRSDGRDETGIWLFGVHVSPSYSSPVRKCVSMPNLTHLNGGDGYVSDAAVHRSASRKNRRRMRGNPWTEEEHMRFLRGLDELGKGDWRAISRNYVVTRTPTQVASHAQKYFLRLNCLNNRRRRGSSLFDITIDSVTISRQEKPMVFPVIGESSQTPIRMFQPPVLRISDLSLNDRPPELFLSLAMPSSPSSSDEPNPVDA